VKAIPYKPEEFCVGRITGSPPCQKGHSLVAGNLAERTDHHPEPGSGSRHFMLSFLASHGVEPSVLVEAGR